MRLFWTACFVLVVSVLPARAQVDELIGELTTGAPDARRVAARKLGQIGDEAKPAIPALVKALKTDDDSYVRRFAAEALGSFGPAKGVVSALTAALEDKQSRVVQAAATSLGKMGKEGVQPLVDIVGNKKLTAATRRRAIVALGKLGPLAKDGVPNLMETMKENDLRIDAVEALGNIGPAAKDSLKTMETMMEDRRIRRDRIFASALRTAMRKIRK